MIRALYTASSGLVAQSVKQEIIANNIANAQTPGFKRDKAVASSFAVELENQIAGSQAIKRPAYPDSQATPQIVSIESATDTSQGPIRNTGYALDFAIEGNGAFQVSNSNGATEKTRAGNFHLSAEGDLCTADGDKVLGQNGPIRISDSEWHVTEDGSILSKGGATIDKINIVGSDEKTKIHQNSIEEANVNIVREMVDMIANMRSFEANQKVVAAVDGTLDRLISEVGKV